MLQPVGNSTWNPWRGCDKVSPGCAHCYMFADQRRYGQDPTTVVRTADATFYAPLRKKAWRDARDQALANRGRHFVFTCSWSDWFHPAADAWREEAWEIIRQTPESTYQILTKRPERIADHLPWDWALDGIPYPNVWLGVTIENRRFTGRANVLREVPAAVRFISAEPLLGPLISRTPCPSNARCATAAHDEDDACACSYEAPGRGPYDIFGLEPWSLNLDGIDWVITGGESGPGHRRFDPTWAADIRDACNLSGVAFLHKQNGGPRPTSNGRLLDGRTHDEMPEIA